MQRLRHLEAAEAQEQSLIEFIRWNWPTLEPNRPLVEGWPLEAVCDHLQAVTWGQIKRLLITVPPGFQKSLDVNVFWPGWEWGPQNLPDMRYVNFSYSSQLTERDNGRFRDLMLDPRYTSLWRDRFTLRKTGEVKITNDRTGWKLASSVGGVGTGERGDRILLDDPHNVREGESEAVRTSTVRWFRESMSNRLNDMEEGAIVVIMQRVHEADVAGVILGDGLGYEHLMIPMEFDAGRRCRTSIGWTDPRIEDGDLAWPDRFPPEAVARLKRTLGSYAYTAQYQQQPVPRGGGIIKSDWWELYPEDGEEFDPAGNPTKPLVYPEMEFIVASLDTALTSKTENSRSACTVWGIWRNRHDLLKVMLLYAWAGHLEFHQLVERTILTGRGMDKRLRRDGTSYEVDLGFRPDVVLIENKANGKSLGQELVRLCRPEEFSVKYFDPVKEGGGDIVARANSVAHLFEAGLIYAPDRDWANEVIDECAALPRGAYDDRASSAVQGIRWLRDRGMLLTRDEREDDLAQRRSPKALQPKARPYDV